MVSKHPNHSPPAGAGEATAHHSFGIVEVVVATICALSVAIPSLLASPESGGGTVSAPDPLSLALPALLYYAFCFGCAFFCARQRGLSWRHTFLGYGGQWRALGIGGGLGLLMVIPLLAVSIFSFNICSRLGFDTTPQEAFNILGDEMINKTTRYTLIFIATVLAPFAEETVFRGLLLPGLKNHTGSWLRVIILQGLLFGVIHAHLPTFLPLSIAGVCFGLGYMLTNSLLTPIAMHVAFNACSLALFMIF